MQKIILAHHIVVGTAVFLKIVVSLKVAIKTLTSVTIILFLAPMPQNVENLVNFPKREKTKVHYNSSM